MYCRQVFTILAPTCPTNTDSAAVKRVSKMKLIGKVLKKKWEKYEKNLKTNILYLELTLWEFSHRPWQWWWPSWQRRKLQKRPSTMSLDDVLAGTCPFAYLSSERIYFQFVLTWSHNSGWKLQHIQTWARAGKKRFNGAAVNFPHHGSYVPGPKWWHRPSW